MINTLEIFEELKDTIGSDAAKKIARAVGKVYDELSKAVTRDEFNELKEVVRELAEAQRRTEQGVKELAEAQIRTEHQLGKLVEAQRQTEERVSRFEEAQIRTEEKLTRLEEAAGQLAEAQRQTEHRVEQLAEAQKRTEEEVRSLAKGLRETRKMVGGLSDAVGYGLEDRAIKSLPSLLQERYNIVLTTPLRRKFVHYNNRLDEINIFGQGKCDQVNLTIIGEAKARLSRKHIDDFLRRISRLERYQVIEGEKFLFMLSYSVEPAVETYATSRGVEVIWSYEV